MISETIFSWMVNELTELGLVPQYTTDEFEQIHDNPGPAMRFYGQDESFAGFVHLNDVKEINKITVVLSASRCPDVEDVKAKFESLGVRVVFDQNSSVAW